MIKTQLSPQKEEKRIKKLENEIIKQKRTKEYFKMRYKDAMKELQQLRKDNEPCLIERNKRQEQIIIDLQRELQDLKERLEQLRKRYKEYKQKGGLNSSQP